MPNNNIDDTHPSKKDNSESGDTKPTVRHVEELGSTQPSKVDKPNKSRDVQKKSTQRITPLNKITKLFSYLRIPDSYRIIFIIFSFLTGLLLFSILTGWIGYQSGKNDYLAKANSAASDYLDEQYQLGLEDMQAGRFELALQRFEFVFTQDQSYQDAADKWVEVQLIQNSTATFSGIPITPTPTPSPTLDPRPNEELFNQSVLLINNSNWIESLDTLASLRLADPNYRTVDVDGFIYLALRNRGADRILNNGELESGLYDFSLAEKFAPLDSEAEVYRVWARLYLLGNSFWIAYPEIAASYYSQVAFAAPYLRDASGLTSFYRYWASLLHQAEAFLEKEEWCPASDQYKIVLNAREDAIIQSTALFVEQQCLILTPSPTLTITPTSTTDAMPTQTETSLAANTDTATPGSSTATNTPILSFSPTPTPTNDAPSLTPTSTPTPSPSPTQLPTTSPTDTESPTPSS